MTTINDVQKFLNRFKAKINILGIIYMDERGKNTQALAELEITPAYRREVIDRIEAIDYSEGPIINDRDNRGDLWVFGKDVKGKEVYIKISFGATDRSPICISFHTPKYPMKYPFK
ncbi:MAG: toxin [Rikenellaceae bacterium]